MIVRRGPSSGRALPRPVRDTAPILHHKPKKAKSAPHRARDAAVKAHIAALLASIDLIDPGALSDATRAAVRDCEAAL